MDKATRAKHEDAKRARSEVNKRTQQFIVRDRRS